MNEAERKIRATIERDEKRREALADWPTFLIAYGLPVVIAGLFLYSFTDEGKASAAARYLPWLAAVAYGIYAGMARSSRR